LSDYFIVFCINNTNIHFISFIIKSKSYCCIQTKIENNHQTLGTEEEINETKKTDQQKIDEKENETNKISDEKEIKKKLQEITEQLNKEMDTLNTTIRFGFDDKTDEMYVSVIDTKDNKVIRQIPSEEAMKLAAKMRELVGIN